MLKWWRQTPVFVETNPSQPFYVPEVTYGNAVVSFFAMLT
jgi:hypothetical protein